MFTGIVTRNLLQPARIGAADRPAISLENDQTWSYRELAQQANRYANALHNLGVAAGDRVGMLLYNCLEYWALYLAITRLGAVAVRLNWRLSGEELAYALRDSGASVLCLHDSFGEAVGPALKDTAVRACVVFDYAGSTAADLPGRVEQGTFEGASPNEPTVDEPSLGDPCMIMYTSGTTGHPKGALWTHSNTLWFGAIQAMYWKYDSSAVHLATSPMFHVSGFEDWALPVLMSGGHVVMMRSTGLTIDKVVDVLRHRRCTDAFLPPALIYEWMAKPELADVPELRRVTTGGSPIVRWAIDAMRQRIPGASMEQAYGLTEGGGMSTVMDSDHLDEHPTSVGKPLPLTEARIASQENEHVDAAPGVDGELWVRSPSVCGVYYGKPEATRETFVNGWCRTGDLARITDDGYIYIIGRLKDMIISGGENIYPAEIETILADHPSIQEAAVVGVPDPRYDETPCAVVVLREGEQMAEDDVISYCRDRIATYKSPRHVVFVDSLPRNASGKVLKRVLRSEYSHLGESPSAGKASQVQ